MRTSIAAWLRDATWRLQQAGIETARLDCMVLLEDVLHTDRARLLAHLDTAIRDRELIKLNNFIAQREASLPLAYIRSRAAFYGREFVVNEQVLVPRPETEALIELLKALDLPARPRIADIGTGSGCLGITAALELPGSHVTLYDIESGALGVARRNARRHKVTAVCEASDLLHAKHKIDTIFDVIIANLPYVPDAHPVNIAARKEPVIALFGGEDGLDVYRRFWRQVAALRHKPYHIIVESLPEQHSRHTTLASSSGYRLVATQGFAQRFNASA